MANSKDYDPQAMSDWHTAKLEELFPETIRNDFWRNSSSQLAQKIKGTLGISNRPTYSLKNQNQSIELFDALEVSPSGTTGIIYNQWNNTLDAHVSVVANIAGCSLYG